MLKVLMKSCTETPAFLLFEEYPANQFERRHYRGRQKPGKLIYSNTNLLAHPSFTIKR